MMSINNKSQENNTALHLFIPTASYRETDLDLEPLTTETPTNDVSDTGTGCGDTDTSAGRRVSFQLDNISPTHTGYLQKGRRLAGLLKITNNRIFLLFFLFLTSLPFPPPYIHVYIPTLNT